MTNKTEDDFQTRKRELLRKHKESGNQLLRMVNEMAVDNAIELVHAIFDVLRYTEPLGGKNHKLDTKYAKDVVNLVYGYQNRYLASFLVVCGQEIRSLEMSAEKVQSKAIREEFFLMQELRKRGSKFIEELIKHIEEEQQQQQKNSKERLDPSSDTGAEGKGERDKV